MHAGRASCPTPRTTATPAPTRSATSPRRPAASTCRCSGASGSARSCRSRASRPPRSPSLHGRLNPLGPGKDTITGHWELMGVVTPVPLRTYPDGFPDEILEQLIDATGRGVLLQPALQRHRRDRRLRRAAPRDRRPDRLHVGRLGAPDRRARRRGAARPSSTRPARRAREIMTRRARRRPRDRAPVPRRARRVRAHHGPPRPRARAARPLLPARSCRRGVPVHTVGKIGQVFAGVGVDRRTRAPPTRRRSRWTDAR